MDSNEKTTGLPEANDDELGSDSELERYVAEAEKKNNERKKKTKTSVLVDILTKEPILLDALVREFNAEKSSRSIREGFTRRLEDRPEVVSRHGGSPQMKIWHPEFLTACRLAMEQQLFLFADGSKKDALYTQAIRRMTELSDKAMALLARRKENKEHPESAKKSKKQK